MSLFERLMEARSSTTFTSQKGTDAYIHTDRWKAGRRNKTPKGVFVYPKWKRYPVTAFSRASAAGSLRQAYKHGKPAKKVASKVKSNKSLNMCPAIMPGCKDRRGKHGKGGPPEYATSCQGKHCDVQGTPVDHGGKKTWPWKFTVDRDPKWVGSDWAKRGAGKKKAGKKQSPNKVKKK